MLNAPPRSRNALLTAEDRARAVCISRALGQARQRACDGAATDAAQLQQQIADAIADGGGQVDYVEVVDACTLQPLSGDVRGMEVLAAAAAFFGRVRLIDNVEFTS